LTGAVNCDADRRGPRGRIARRSGTHQVLATRERRLAKSPPPHPLPEGKSVYEVVAGTWPGDETDQQIRELLEKLS
jgi:hypothetical protein